MRIGTNGIVVNEFGQVLLIQRDDSRTFAPPGGALEADELPTDGVTREVREETGLIVLPVRLVGMYFWPHKPEGFLAFVFRCLQRGGELKTSAESLQVGFYPPNSLPNRMAASHFERVMDGLKHQGGPPRWGVHPLTWQTRLGRFLLNHVVYRWKDVSRRFRGESPYQSPPSYQTAAFVVLQNPAGEVVWVKQGEQWTLPGGDGQTMEPPWETAVRHTTRLTGYTPTLTNLTGVYLHKGQQCMTFVFTANWPIQTDVPDHVAMFARQNFPTTQDVNQISYATDANRAEETLFRLCNPTL